MIEYPNQPQIAVGAVIVHDRKVLLVQRGQPPSRNQWSVPGGCVHLGEPLHTALAREVREETGLTIEVGKLLYHCEIIQHDDQNRVRFHYVILDYLARFTGGDPAAASDVTDARWFSLAEAKKLACAEGIVALLEKALVEWAAGS